MTNATPEAAGATPHEESVPDAAAAESPEDAAASPPPGLWRVLEPADPTDAVPHEERLRGTGNLGWALIGASLRGKSHAHDGTYREDAFKMVSAGGWHIVAVADGLGSCSLSRVGAAVAAQAAVAAADAVLRDLSADHDDDALHTALRAGLEQGLAAVAKEAERRQVALRELSTTLLLLLHLAAADHHLVAAAQVGDGLLAVWADDGSVTVLAESLQGEYGAQVVPLTGKGAVERALNTAAVQRFEQPPRMLVAMTDGVADDFFPPEERLPKLLEHLATTAARDDADIALLDLLRYEKRGSFDDRTLVMLCPSRTNGEPETNR